MSEIEFVGDDPTSGETECPAVWSVPGGMFIRGKTVDDEQVSARLGQDVAKGEDESDIWVPDRLFPSMQEGIDGTFTPGRQGKGQPDFPYLLDHTRHSVIRFEMRDAYDPNFPAFDHWKRTGDASTYDWSTFEPMVRASIARGVIWRRVRIISRPMSEYMRWEHAITEANIRFGEDIRWLWRDEAADLLVPAADCFVFDGRIIRWNFQRGDDTNPKVYTYSSDPRVARDIAGSFEVAWGRATPHADFKPE